MTDSTIGLGQEYRSIRRTLVNAGLVTDSIDALWSWTPFAERLRRCGVEQLSASSEDAGVLESHLLKGQMPQVTQVAGRSQMFGEESDSNFSRFIVNMMATQPPAAYLPTNKPA